MSSAKPAAGSSILQGQMMSMPLLISSLIRHADRHHGDTEIVSRRTEGDIHHSDWRTLHTRARRMARALAKLGIGTSDRVATLAWNGYRHLELYYAVSGSGAILHTLNPRLHADQLAYMIEHAEDKVLFFDAGFLNILEDLAPRCDSVRNWVAMIDRDHMPKSSQLKDLICYEDLIDAHDDDFVWPEFDENTASSLCYSSGTTGHPKGVLYSHRSTLLHAFASALPDALGVSATDSVMPVVPMFHVNAWGLPYTSALVGAKMVMPGAALDGAALYDLIESEQVTMSAGVPTVWLGLLNHIKAHGLRFSSFKRCVIGGSACPPAMIRSFEDDYDVSVLHAWGMTEMSPLGTVASLKNRHLALDETTRQQILTKQGRVLSGVDMRIVDDAGNDLPWDGQAFGDLLVRGPWVLSRYYREEGEGSLLRDAAGNAWFPTGDVATIDGEGFMQITDRSKDVIKSGGEWIGSIDLENIAMSHPAVAMAAAIAVPHPKWDERPLLVVVLRPDAHVTRAGLLAHYEGRVAKWWIPDDVAFVDALPLGATGKILKNRLREMFRDHKLPTA